LRSPAEFYATFVEIIAREIACSIELDGACAFLLGDLGTSAERVGAGLDTAGLCALVASL
jgi:hypothetical protein